jgi:thermitase
MSRLWLRICGLLTVVPILLTLAFAPATMLAQESAADEYVPGEVLIKLYNAADLAGVAQAFGLDPTPLDQFGTRPIYQLAIDDGTPPPDKAAALDGDSRVANAEPNYIGQTPEGIGRAPWAGGRAPWAGGDGAGAHAGQWAAGRIRLPEAHTVTRGAGVTVAVLDTGVDASHSELAGRVGPGYDFVNMDSDAREEGSIADESYGHGTHVAGLVALAAPEATIMPVRMLEPDGSGNLWVAIEALAFAVNPDGDAQTAEDSADVINMSFSFERQSRLLEGLVREVTCEDDDHENGDENLCDASGGSGVVFVAAAGNRGSSMPEYPAAEPVVGMLAVAASTQADELADFSNRGGWVHVAAPGDQIVSSLPGNGYGTWSGTSMAAPLVAGTAALVRARNPGLNAIAAASRVIDASADIGGAVPRRLDAAVALGKPRSYGAVQCQGTIAAIPVDSVTVPSGATCTLNGTRIAGAVKVGQNASLSASDILVGGGVEGLKATNITLSSAFVTGSIQLKEGGAATLDRTRIGGSVQLEKNTQAILITESSIGSSLQAKENSGGVTILSNDIASSAQLEKNTGALLHIADNIIGSDLQVKENSGGVTILSNDIASTLQCEQNSPAPTSTGNNANQTQGQCS